MKNLKTFGELNENNPNMLNESKEDQSQLSSALDKVATDFWKKRGAKFGKKQTLKDFKIDKEFASTPSKFTEDTEFITESASIEVGGYDGRRIVCALWISPFKKDGSKGQQIRLTWLPLSKY